MFPQESGGGSPRAHFCSSDSGHGCTQAHASSCAPGLPPQALFWETPSPIFCLFLSVIDLPVLGRARFYQPGTAGSLPRPAAGCSLSSQWPSVLRSSPLSIVRLISLGRLRRALLRSLFLLTHIVQLSSPAPTEGLTFGPSPPVFSSSVSISCAAGVRLSLLLLS